MAEYSPHDPRDGFDLERHPTSCFAHFAADRHNPSGIQQDVALQLAWRISEITPRRVKLAVPRVDGQTLAVLDAHSKDIETIEQHFETSLN